MNPSEPTGQPSRLQKFNDGEWAQPAEPTGQQQPFPYRIRLNEITGTYEVLYRERRASLEQLTALLKAADQTQPSNKAPESPSPNGLTEDAINAMLDEGISERHPFNINERDACRYGIKWAAAQLRAEVERLKEELEKLKSL